MFKVNIAKWIAREINGTELALLRAEDSLLEAQMRVKAMRQRLDRLKTRQELDAERSKRAALRAPVPELVGAYTIPRQGV